MGQQIDMFRDEDAIVAPRVTPRKAPRPALHSTDSEELWLRRLAETGRYRILRKLMPRRVVDRAASALPRVGILVDVETTGLDHAKDEIIELGIVAFTYDDGGRFGDVVGVFSGLRQPYNPIPKVITTLTGITDDMVAGQTIDVEEVEAFIRPADLVIAHNAKFDRPFCERFAPGFAPKPWGCSMSDVSWSDRGFEGTKLGYLVAQSGYFHDGHRAVDDCHALLEVLSRPMPEASDTAFAELLKNSAAAKLRIWAENSPFDMKEHLKARGYRWSDGSDGGPKSWWIDVSEAEGEEELRFLRTDIYRWADAEPPTQRLTAVDRFKART
jgi:DNA polymerase-3 subunit epsilon